MDVRIRILFIILLFWQIMVFFQRREVDLDKETEKLQEKLRFVPGGMQDVILLITQIIAAVAFAINTVLLAYSLQLLHYGWLSVIPITSFLILNCDLTIFFSHTLKEYLHRGNHKWVKPLRVWYLVAAIAWFGLMIVIP